MDYHSGTPTPPSKSYYNKSALMIVLALLIGLVVITFIHMTSNQEPSVSEVINKEAAHPGSSPTPVKNIHQDQNNSTVNVKASTTINSAATPARSKEDQQGSSSTTGNDQDDISCSANDREAGLCQ